MPGAGLEAAALQPTDFKSDPLAGLGNTKKHNGALGQGVSRCAVFVASG